jgi:drug/metabolite transporter (DMT)-like permease
LPWLQVALRRLLTAVADDDRIRQRSATANITALDYLQVPFLAVGGWILGERMNSWQGWAIVLGFAGAVLIIRPTPASVDPIYLAALACAAAVATSWVLTRRAEAENEPPLTLMAWGSLAGAVLSGAASIGQPWPAPSFWLLLMMICGPVGSYRGILAVRHAPGRHRSTTTCACQW